MKVKFCFNHLDYAICLYRSIGLLGYRQAIKHLLLIMLFVLVGRGFVFSQTAEAIVTLVNANEVGVVNPIGNVSTGVIDNDSPVKEVTSWINVPGGFHLQLDLGTDPNNFLSAAVSPIQASSEATNTIVNAHIIDAESQASSWTYEANIAGIGAFTNFSDIAFRFGVRTGDFLKHYEVRYYLEFVKDNNNPSIDSYVIYRKRLYYDKGHVDLVGDNWTIDIDFDGDTYRLKVTDLNGNAEVLECSSSLENDVLQALECEGTFLEGTVQMFISPYGRPNDGQGIVSFLLEGYTTGNTIGCTAPDCAPDLVYDYSGSTEDINDDKPITDCSQTVWPCFGLGPNLLIDENLNEGKGINVQTEEQSIDIYPNPASQELYVQLNIPHDDIIEVVVFEETGKIIKKLSRKLTKGLHVIPVNMIELPGGMYYIKINSKFEFETQKVTLIK